MSKQSGPENKNISKDIALDILRGVYDKLHQTDREEANNDYVRALNNIEKNNAFDQAAMQRLSQWRNKKEKITLTEFKQIHTLFKELSVNLTPDITIELVENLKSHFRFLSADVQKKEGVHYNLFIKFLQSMQGNNHDTPALKLSKVTNYITRSLNENKNNGIALLMQKLVSEMASPSMQSRQGVPPRSFPTKENSPNLTPAERDKTRNKF